MGVTADGCCKRPNATATHQWHNSGSARPVRHSLPNRLELAATSRMQKGAHAAHKHRDIHTFKGARGGVGRVWARVWVWLASGGFVPGPFVSKNTWSTRAVPRCPALSRAHPATPPPAPTSRTLLHKHCGREPGRLPRVCAFMGVHSSPKIATQASQKPKTGKKKKKGLSGTQSSKTRGLHCSSQIVRAQRLHNSRGPL